MFNALARDEVDAPTITGAEQQSSVAHRDSSRVTHFTFKNARESGDITLTDKQEKMKREMAILAQLTGVDDKLKLAILEATDEQQGKMIASLKERRAPFQWDEGGVDPFAVAAEQKRDRAIAYIEQQRKEHVALVERTRRERVREAKRRGRQPLPYDEWTEFGMPSEGKAPIRGLGGDPSWRDTKDANLTPRAPKFGAPAAPASASPRGRRPPLHPTSPRNASARPRTAAGPPLLSPRSVVSGAVPHALDGSLRRPMSARPSTSGTVEAATKASKAEHLIMLNTLRALDASAPGWKLTKFRAVAPKVDSHNGRRGLSPRWGKYGYSPSS